MWVEDNRLLVANLKRVKGTRYVVGGGMEKRVGCGGVGRGAGAGRVLGDDRWW